MANVYLNIAEQILLAGRKPMTPSEILDAAYMADMVPFYLHGAAQHKTMHARLSEDISRYMEGSRFVRTAPALFFLRKLQNDPSVPEAFKSEYRAPPRRKELRREAILAINAAALLSTHVDLQRVPLRRVRDCLQQGDYIYSHWAALRNSTAYVPVHSFVVVHRNHHVLSFRCGKFTPQSDPLHGKRSVGFGGAVLAGDLDLLYDSFYGIIGNGINEISYGLGLPRRLAETARYSNVIRPHFGAIVRPHKAALQYLHVVLTYRCPDEFTPAKVALSLNDLRWIYASGGVNRVADYDATSRLLFDHGYLEELATSD